jgi:hypothetical protein
VYKPFIDFYRKKQEIVLFCGFFKDLFKSVQLRIFISNVPQSPHHFFDGIRSTLNLFFLSCTHYLYSTHQVSFSWNNIHRQVHNSCNFLNIFLCIFSDPKLTGNIFDTPFEGKWNFNFPKNLFNNWMKLFTSKFWTYPCV